RVPNSTAQSFAHSTSPYPSILIEILVLAPHLKKRQKEKHMRINPCVSLREKEPDPCTTLRVGREPQP
ncbi:MAG: hypothetical protein ACLU2L_05555, partial [Fenollaria timonensis]